VPRLEKMSERSPHHSRINNYDEIPHQIDFEKRYSDQEQTISLTFSVAGDNVSSQCVRVLDF